MDLVSDLARDEDIEYDYEVGVSEVLVERSGNERRRLQVLKEVPFQSQEDESRDVQTYKRPEGARDGRDRGTSPSRSGQTVEGAREGGGGGTSPSRSGHMSRTV